MSKNALGFQISVFFNRQYLVNRLTYDSEHVIDMNERDKVWEWVFWKKFLSGQMGHFGPKNGASL